MKKNQRGFSVIEALLILVIVGLLGFVGWYVWHSKNQTDKNLDEASNTSQSSAPKTSKTETKPTVDETSNWKTYEGTYFTFKYPADWKPSKNSGFPGVGRESVSLGIPGTIFEGQQSLGFIEGTYQEAVTHKPDGLIKEGKININGKSGTKWVAKDTVGVSYYYKSPGIANNEYFDIGVGGPNGQQITELEKTLDLLIKTVKFKP